MGSGLQLVLQIVGVLVGGGILQLIIALIKRRAEIRSLNTTSDSNVLTQANSFIQRLQEDSTTQRGEIERAHRRTDDLQRQLDEERRDFVRRMNGAQAEISRLGAELARLQIDLNIAHRQIEQLQQ